MFTTTPFFRPSSWPQRLIALGGVVLVLAMSWLAVDCGAHQQLHAMPDEHAGCAHDGAHSREDSHQPDRAPAPCEDPGCVVARFLAGATDLLVLAWLILMFVLRAVARVATRETSWVPTRFASHAPSCGPPLRA